MGEEMRNKYRAWDKKKKKMFYLDGVIHLHLGLTAWTFSSPDEVYVCGGKRDDGVLMQYTTLKDNENKELYYFDAIETYAGNRKLGRTVIKSLNDLVELILARSESGINFKIIGNAFENPEFQEGK